MKDGITSTDIIMFSLLLFSLLKLSEINDHDERESDLLSQLKLAIENEDYERAAELRDIIKEL